MLSKFLVISKLMVLVFVKKEIIVEYKMELPCSFFC